MDNSAVGVDTSQFIDKILGEMKNTFNKTDNRQVPLVESQSSSHIKSSTELIETNANLTVSSSDVVENHKENDNCLNEDELVYKCNAHNKGRVEIDVLDCQINSEYVEFKHENNGDGDENTELRNNNTFICFRKPVTNTVAKSKKNSEESSRRSLKSKLSEDTELKRSARRRKSKDYGESVLQSAIARKEKSYNESNKPQRLTRQLKPTPKILQNLANAAAVKENTKIKSSKLTEKQKHNDIVGDTNISTEDSAMQILDERLCRKHKHDNGKHAKRTSKRLKSSNSGKDSDSDQNISAVIKTCGSSIQSDKGDKVVRNKTNEERNYRRSQRISSSRREDLLSNVDVMELPEPSLADQASMFPADPVCSSVGAELIASKLCLCVQPTQIYSAVIDDIMFCTAVDNVGEKLLGCNNIVNFNDVPMMRPSFRVPYALLCDVHRNRMLRHNCCPTCGIFCTEGKFVQCENKHQYHRDCQISVGDIQCCPHCGSLTPDNDVSITMYSAKKPVFLTKQKKSYPPAKITFQQIHNEEVIKRSASPLIPVGAIPISIINDSRQITCDTETILCAIEHEDYCKLAIILGSSSVSLSSLLKSEDGTSVLHYSAKNGFLPAIHMLYVAGMELDILDKDQNTPLMVAVLQFKNSVVKYLIKAGANINFKGTDGMTALHLAAECGNLVACELLIDAAVDKNQYVNCADDGGWTSLVWACEHNHLSIAKYLLKKYANPLLRDLKQNVALHWAAFNGCEEIVELLINYGSDVNVVNVQGDTPLHNAARQDNYNAVVVLLIRGGCVSVMNNINETPLDCAQPQSDCRNVIMLNVHLQHKSKPAILCNDISLGKEINPIQCVNYVDDFPKPADFIYVSEYCTSNVNVDRNINNLLACNCEDNCVGNNCLCVLNSLSKWYDEDGKLLPSFNFSDAPMIFECNQLCSCNVLICKNRIVQRGVTQRFQIFRTRIKGWGICTLNLIQKGSFVCEYIGEIVSDLEADQREDDSYFFDLDNRENNTFCIDAKKYGNFARFINHSCDPNLIPVKVFTDHHDLKFPRVALFASRDIKPNEEICFDYGEKFWIVKYKEFTCHCKSTNCKYSEECIADTLENYNKHVEDLEEGNISNISLDKIN